VASFEIGEWVGVNYHRWHQPGRIVDVLPSSTEVLYRIDFVGGFTLHLSDDEIFRTGPPEPGVTYGPPQQGLTEPRAAD
jgi:hypothetical protein